MRYILQNCWCAVPIQSGARKLLLCAREPCACAGRCGGAENEAHTAQRRSAALVGSQSSPARLPLPGPPLTCCQEQAGAHSLTLHSELLLRWSSGSAAVLK